MTECVLIVGGGIMGGDIATSFAAAGWRVEVMSPSASTRERLAGRVKAGLAALGADPSCAASVRAHAALSDVPWPSVGLVIESVTEDLALKQKLFAEIEPLARAGVPLATNTSSFPITEIGGRLRTRGRVCGAHYFMPAHLVPLVEVIRAEFTDAAVAERVAEMVRAAGKLPVLVQRDVAGFLANRMQHALAREAFWLLENGVASAADIDAAVRYGFGFRFLACGPLMQKEMSGWDTHFRAATTIYPQLSNAGGPPQPLRELMASGRLGMKAGKGMWDWDAARIAARKAAYEKTLKASLAILQADQAAP